MFTDNLRLTSELGIQLQYMLVFQAVINILFNKNIY